MTPSPLFFFLSSFIISFVFFTIICGIVKFWHDICDYWPPNNKFLGPPVLMKVIYYHPVTKY